MENSIFEHQKIFKKYEFRGFFKYIAKGMKPGMNPISEKDEEEEEEKNEVPRVSKLI